MKNKHVRLLVPVLLSVASFANGQRAEKFDIVSFTPPVGWHEQKTDASRSYSKIDEKAGTFCIITLAISIPSRGSSKADFEVIWKTLVADQLKPASPPQMGGSGPKQGWMGEVGVAAFEAEGLKGAAMLTTLTGNGRAIGVLALTNSEGHQKDIEAFVDGITLPAVVREKPQARVENNSRLIGKWNRTSSGHPTYADPVSWGTAGYTKSRYEFKTDGTYLYTERSFRMMMQNIIVVKETGKYSVNGNSLTISPAKSSIVSYKKAGGCRCPGCPPKIAESRSGNYHVQIRLSLFRGNTGMEPRPASRHHDPT